jgi:hypothetical protein
VPGAQQEPAPLTEKVRGGQGVHEVAPAAEKNPAGQRPVQLLAPAVDENEPGGQGAHADAPLEEYVPIGQAAQARAPTASLYVPLGQAKEYCPVGQ